MDNTDKILDNDSEYTLDCEGILLNRVFHELKQVNVSRKYAELLTDKHIIRSNWYNIIIMALSGIGAILSIVSPTITVVAASIVAIISIANQYMPALFIKPDDLTKLLKHQTEYTVYFNKLQNLFTDFNFNNIDYKEANNIFDALIEDNSSKTANLSRIFGRMDKKIERKAVDWSDNYLNCIYNGKK